jgi:hypothetical protein
MALTVILPSGLSNTGNFAVGSLSATGNVTGNYILGNGALLTGVITSVANINNGTSNVTVVSSGGNITVGVGGTSNVAVFATTGEYVSGLLSVTGNVVANNGMFTNIVNVASYTGSLVSVTGNVVSGNLSVSGNVIAGALPSYTPVNAPLQTSGNINSYVQLIVQNKSSGNLATSDISAVADNGSDVDTFISMGINSSTYSDPGYTLYGPNDAYLYNVGNTTTGGGNLIINTLSTKDIIFALNGGLIANEIGRFKVGFGLSVTGAISATGNVTANNGMFTNIVNVTSYTGTVVSVTGNVTANNGMFTNIVNVASHTGTVVSVTGNVTGNYFIGNGSQLTGIATGAASNISNGTSNIQIVAANANAIVNIGGTSNVVVFANTGAYVTGVISATGNITGGNLITPGSGGAISGAGNITGGNISSSGNVNAGNVVAATVSVTSNVIVAGTGGSISGTGNITAGNLLTSGLISATGNVTGNYFIGNGFALTGILATSLANGTSSIQLPVVNGNATINIGGTSNVAVFANTGAYITGVISVTGNVVANNGTFTTIVNTASFTGAVVSVTGNVTGGNISTAGNVVANNGTFTTIVNTASFTGAVVSVTGNVTGGNISTAGNVNGANIVATTLSATSNVVAVGVQASGNISATGNIAAGNISATGIAGTLSTASQTSITAIGTLTSLIVSGGTQNIRLGSSMTTGGVIIGGPSQTTGNIVLGQSANTSVVEIASGSTISGNVKTINMGVGGGAGSTTTISIGPVTATTAAGTATFNTATTVAIANTSGTALSVAGNIIGGNLNTTGTLSTSGNIAANNVIATTISNAASFTGGVVSVTGNVIANNGIFTNIVNVASHTGTIVSITGNITAAGGVFGLGNISTTGNVQAGFFVGNGSALTGIAASAPTSVVNGTTNFTLAASGNANLTIAGTSNVVQWATTGQYVTGLVSASGNVTGGNLISAALVQGATVSSSGNVVTVGVAATGNISATANVQGGNGVFTTIVSAASHTGGLVSVTGTVTGSQFNGSGAGLTSIPGANVTGTVPNATTAVVAGTVTTAAQGNITSVGTLSSLVVSGQITGSGGTALVLNATNAGMEIGNPTATNTPYIDFHSSGNAAADYDFRILASGGANSATAGTGTLQLQGALVTATGNVTVAGQITVNSGSNVTAIINGASNAVGNIGSATTFFNRLFAQATTALYADLAEMYTTDAEYPPGTVLIFGGTQEVTISTVTHDHRVAGVVSTNPAHIMNSGLQGEFTVAVALTGRVPVSVIGNISAGDRVVTSNRAGVAEALDMARYQPGVIIGKALQSYSGNGIGVIEVVVGRL